MCTCDLRKTSFKLSLLVICTYLQIGTCGMRLFRQLGYFDDRKTNFDIHPAMSPCPNIFRYRYEDSGYLYGVIEIEAPHSNRINLEMELSVANRVNKGAEGSITLPYHNDKEVIDNVLQGRFLSFRVNFPTWRRYQPKVRRIVLNDKLICSGEPYTPNRVPVVTTINLRYKLEVNAISLGSELPQRGGQGFNFNSNADGDNHPILDIQNENYNRPSRNPYNFNPITAKTTPKIVFKPDRNLKNDNPYSDNPFLNRLSTVNPNPSDEKNVFNNFDITTTQRIFPSISQENPATQSPRLNSNPIIKDSTSQSIDNACGRPVVTNSLILNGESVPRGAFPWLVAIFVKTDRGLAYQCTGTLISKRHVVTAAHCVKEGTYLSNPDKIVLLMGRLNIQDWGGSEDERIIGADDLYVHPDYKFSKADADIAVIVMKAEVSFTNFIRPICIWKDDDDLSSIVGRKGTVVGWGRDEHGHKVSPEPKQIEMPIVSQEKCLRSDDSFVHITSERTFCAGDRKGSGPCNGDSGGGFVMLRNGKWHLRGVVSMSLSDVHTKTCDLSNYVVFTDASKYKNWLLEKIK
ncbi:hypothetical protein WA026_002797 [Henosepilachna vigintioctopunctata]|uniref:Peptidase S1 domain-containing protein n=1 Tax=Henosepilachna vigintioctopunctata TaxID=420089 RepID=A0AAW1U3E1_9CUCU